MGIRKAFNKLVSMLRAHVGETFLASTSLGVAYPVSKSIFLMTNGMNYVREDACQLRMKGGEDEGCSLSLRGQFVKCDGRRA